MRFSVVVPVYNAEAYLEPCVESLIHQTCKDFELILVDDGSKDRSPEMVDNYMIKYPFIKAVHQTNGGQFAARQVGIKLAQGEYTIFLDSDDCLREDTLEILERYIQRYSTPDIVFHEMSVHPDYSQPLIQYPYQDGTLFEGDSKKEIYHLLATSVLLNSMCSKVYSTSLLKNVQWDEALIKSIRNGEDLMQNLPIFSTANRIVYCSEVLYYYRQVEGSVTHAYSPTYFESEKIISKEVSRKNT